MPLRPLDAKTGNDLRVRKARGKTAKISILDLRRLPVDTIIALRCLRQPFFECIVESEFRIVSPKNAFLVSIENLRFIPSQFFSGRCLACSGLATFHSTGRKGALLDCSVYEDADALRLAELLAERAPVSDAELEEALAKIDPWA